MSDDWVDDPTGICPDAPRLGDGLPQRHEAEREHDMENIDPETGIAPVVHRCRFCGGVMRRASVDDRLAEFEGGSERDER